MSKTLKFIRQVVRGEEGEHPLTRIDRLTVLAELAATVICVVGGLIGIPFFGWKSPVVAIMALGALWTVGGLSGIHA